MRIIIFHSFAEVEAVQCWFTSVRHENVSVWVATESFYATLVYHRMPLEIQEKQMYENGALKEDLARFCRNALHSKVQRRRIEQVSRRLGNKKGKCGVPALFRA